MHHLAEVGLTFLILTKGYWGKDPDLLKLKRRAAQKNTYKGKEKRIYYLYLVHEDTEIDETEFHFKYPNQLAKETALYLGKI